jgi:hemolysin activation/secretion protein
MNKVSVLMLVIMVVVFSTSYSLAQVTPDSTDPAKVIKSFEDNKLNNRTNKDNLLDVTEEVEDIKEGDNKKIFTLRDVVLEGSTIYSKSDIEEAIESYLGTEVSFNDLNSIARLLTKKYRQDGYILSSVILPPQNIKNDTVRFQVLEGYISNVVLVGEYKDKFKLINELAEKLKSEGAVNKELIERYLLLIDDLPGITARSVLRPSDLPGGGELVITIAQDKMEGYVSADNLGSDYLGPYRGTVVGSFNSMLGINDRTTLRSIVSSQTDEMQFFDIEHEQQVGSEGAVIKGRFANTDTEPGSSTLRILDLVGSSQLFDIEMKYPVIRSRIKNSNFSVGFNSINSETEILGAVIAEDRVRTIRTGFDGDYSDSFSGVNTYDVSYRKAVDLFDTTSDGVGRSRVNGMHDASRFNIDLSRIQNLGKGISLYFAFEGQYSDNPLLSSEEFSVGGSSFGRAYDSGEISGDQGAAGLFEMRYSQAINNDYFNSYQLFSYYDAGKVWNHDIAVGEKKDDGLTSAGAGVRMNMIYEIFTSLEINKPISREVNSQGNSDPRFFFNVIKKF